ncbi:hypothetical protein [Brevibacillus laterosporus]|uniref:Uncharacterized protein n=1 Tax=Brevibacillus laterosporus TaxID=1465 RepID=A0AAP3G9F5_BRELA|nr:hypothetical protein [Brevibacillus laterosporus]MCR8982398.1 hypothetical protein [Brevibacillus laterosporus]MCZ0809553.1 hypothetical protein [Brevibacillus laterosporus]MCZ0828085.1 hypothetical protein [Brevibacillus laterosporus]MCZ0852116.1 hypothetical protein [Brevibacillus laterosporus]
MKEQHVPQYFLNQVVAELGEKCESIFNELKESNIRNFLKDIISSEFTPTNTNELRRITYKYSQATKKRWADSLKESIHSNKKSSKNTELMKEVELLEKLVEMYGSAELKNYRMWIPSKN